MQNETHSQTGRNLTGELYLSAFVLFSKLGLKWPGVKNSDAHIGITWLTLFETIFLQNLFVFLQIETRHRVNEQYWLVGVIFFAIFSTNYYYLMVRRYGSLHKEKFRALHKVKWDLMLVVVSVVILIVGMTIFAGTSYHRTFSIPGS